MKTLASRNNQRINIQQNLQNHIAILIDSSGSMSHLTEKVRQVFQNQIAFLKDQSLQFNQETRVSVYTFDSSCECVVWDMDVTRLESVPPYSCAGWTSLMDCVNLAISDLRSIPEKYGDHAFVVYVLTDGEENKSSITTDQFRKVLGNIPENFTITAMVPNSNAALFLEKLGIPKGNIDKWDLSERGVEEVGRRFENSIRSFYKSRSLGVRSTSAFMVDAENISNRDAINNLQEIRNPRFFANPDVKAVQIRHLVESNGIPYVIGNSFYELVKNEHIQPQKEIAIWNKKTGKVYAGNKARQMIGLPNYEIKVSPGEFGDWVVFVQSTSVNRNIIPKQRVLVVN